MVATTIELGAERMTDPVRAALYDDLFNAHYAAVLRLCRLLLDDGHEAEEVAQDVFFKVFQELRIQKVNQPKPMIWKPWIMKVSINACRDRRRSGWWKMWRATGDIVQEANHPRITETPEDTLLNRELQGRIWRAFQQLSKRQREVFALRYIDGWSTDEAASLLGISSGSVKRLLFRAVHRMRNALGERS